MAIFPPIPTRIRIYGDELYGRGLIGFARKRLSDLVTDAGFNNLQTHSNKIQLDDGSIIITNICYGLSTIDIYTPGYQEIENPEQEIKCFCQCHCATAVIRLIKYDVACYKYLSDYQPRYDIDLCMVNGYLSVDNVLAIDKTPYVTGQTVIVAWTPELEIGEDYSGQAEIMCKSIDDIQASKLRITSLLPYGDSDKVWIEYYD